MGNFFQKISEKIKAMIAKAKYDERVKFAHDTLNQFKEISDGVYDSKKPLETNDFVGYFEDADFKEERIDRVACFEFHVMGFTFIIVYKITSLHGSTIVTFTTSEEVKDIERLKVLTNYNSDMAPYARIDNLYFWVSSDNVFHYKHLNNDGSYQASEDSDFKLNVIPNYLKSLKHYIEKVEKEEMALHDKIVA